MITITTTREIAKQIAQQIHEWRKQNITGYDADSWANCNSSDEEYDDLYKHQTDELWFVPLDNENCLNLEGVENLPEGWSDESLIL